MKFYTILLGFTLSLSNSCWSFCSYQTIVHYDMCRADNHHNSSRKKSLAVGTVTTVAGLAGAWYLLTLDYSKPRPYIYGYESWYLTNCVLLTVVGLRELAHGLFEE